MARPIDTQPSNLSLLEMLAKVLTYNNFQFDHKNYLRVVGTAIGTRVAPSYTSIVMSNFKKTTRLHIPPQTEIVV